MVKLISILLFGLLFAGSVFAQSQPPAATGAAEPMAANAPMQEYSLEVDGIKNYYHFEKIRDALYDRLPSGSVIFQKLERRGRVVLNVKSPLTSESIAQAITHLTFKPEESGPLMVSEVEGNKIRAKVQ